jgi:hypothetical protein
MHWTLKTILPLFDMIRNNIALNVVIGLRIQK